jgi:hypothetical protein
MSLPASVLSAGRVAVGISFLVAPEKGGETWVGARAARRPATQLLMLAIGARDVALGAGALGALRRGERRSARAWMVGQFLCDLTDLAATVRARDDIPRTSFRAVSAIAAGSAATAAWGAAALREPAPGPG